MEQQGFKLESTTAEITLLKQGVELVIAMLSQEDMVAREQLVCTHCYFNWHTTVMRLLSLIYVAGK